MIQITFQCFCESKKKYRLVFDGGSEGEYSLDICKRCYPNQEKKFLIEEKVILN